MTIRKESETNSYKVLFLFDWNQSPGQKEVLIFSIGSFQDWYTTNSWRIIFYFYFYLQGNQIHSFLIKNQDRQINSI